MSSRPQSIDRGRALTMGALAAAAVLLVLPFREGLAYMVEIWMARPEYSHGILVPFIAAFLIWQRRDRLAGMELRGSWKGVPVIAVAACLYLLGELATIYTLVQGAFVIALYGLVLSLAGPQVFRQLAMPLITLLFMVPLPDFLLNNFSAQMQLLSSRIGVWFIRLAGISVYLEGNVIDLGGYQLQVAEACDGLRYLFPLMTLGFLMAYLFRAPLWKRAALFLSSIPLTLLMNSLRVGIIGITVEHWGQSMAEGFLHDFQGWVMFMMSAALLFVEMILLARIGPVKAHWRSLFGLESANTGNVTALPALQKFPVPFAVSAAILGAVALAAVVLPSRVEAVPARAGFAEFPRELADWEGRREAMEQIYLDTLKLDDYVLADYRRDHAGHEPAGGDRAATPVNLYAAWYDSQRKGESVHSPRSCIPGGGWQIRSLEPVTVDGAFVEGQPLRANRVLIEFGAQRQVVYYWFQQRGRVVTNEYLVKWFIFWDALTRNRTDGALVRLTAPVLAGDTPEDADAVLRDFARVLTPLLGRYVPG